MIKTKHSKFIKKIFHPPQKKNYLLLIIYVNVKDKNANIER